MKIFFLFFVMNYTYRGYLMIFIDNNNCICVIYAYEEGNGVKLTKL